MEAVDLVLESDGYTIYLSLYTVRMQPYMCYTMHMLDMVYLQPLVIGCPL